MPVDAAPILLKALRDAKPEVRRIAARALGELHCAAAAQELVRALSDADFGIVEEAAKALGEIGDPQALSALKHIYSNQTQYGTGTAKTAALAAAKLGDETALTWIEEFRCGFRSTQFPGAADLILRENEVNEFVSSLVRRPQMRAIITLGIFCARSPVDSADCAAELAAQFFSKGISQKVVPYVVAKLKDQNPVMRLGAATVLGFLRNTTAIAPLVQLCGWNDTRAITMDDSFIKELSTPTWDIARRARLAAADSLARLGDHRGIELVVNIDLLRLRSSAARGEFKTHYNIVDNPFPLLIARLVQFGDARAVGPLLETMVCATKVITASVSKTGKEQRLHVHDARLLPLFRRLLTDAPESLDARDVQQLVHLRLGIRKRAWEGHGDFVQETFELADVDCQDIRELARLELSRRTARGAN